MQCPKCGFEQKELLAECRKCGIVFAKYVRASEAAEPAPLTPEEESALQDKQDSRQEFIYRIVAVPAALILARLLVAVAPSAVRMLSMWVHESGHAVSAWLCGFTAMPGPWFTPVDSERSRALSVMLAGLIAFGGFHAWQKRRWFWVVAGGATLLVLLFCTLRLYSDQAQQLIIFGGDAGCFVLGTILMMTFYARRENAVYRNGLRWGFLVIGALSFMDAFAVWSGGIERIPFGENENGMSDPSVLTELYGWSVPLLMSRYYRLAIFCLMVLGCVYVGALSRRERAPRSGG